MAHAFALHDPSSSHLTSPAFAPAEAEAEASSSTSTSDPAPPAPSLHEMVLEYPGQFPFLSHMSQSFFRWQKPDLSDSHPHPLPNGLPRPLSNGLSNGIANGISNGLSNGLANGHHAYEPPHKRRRVSASAPRPLPIISDALATQPASQLPVERPPATSSLRLELSSICTHIPKRYRLTLPSPDASITTLPAKCRLTIRRGSSASGNPLYCDAKDFDLSIRKDSAGHHELSCAEPRPVFIIPRDKLTVISRPDGRSGLCPSYSVTVELEPRDASRWLPLSISDLLVEAMGIRDTASPSPYSVLRGTAHKLAGRLELPVLFVPEADGNTLKTMLTHFVMNVDAHWTAGSAAPSAPSQGLPTPVYTIRSPKQTQMGQRGTASTESPTHSTLDHGVDNEDHDVGDDEAQTPSRSLRARQSQKNYNVKALSDQAQGRIRKQHAQLAADLAPHADQLCWLSPTGEKVFLDGNQCICCRSRFKHLGKLISHMNMVHSDLACDIKLSPQGPTIQISADFKVELTPINALHYVRGAKRLDVQSYTNGDQSWVSCSYEEIPDDATQTPRRKRQENLTTPTGRQRKRPLAVVPNIPDTPLYHPVSKQLLTPGEELPRPAPDRGWILQKYKEGLREFSDITPPEREYMLKWDAYLQPLNVTSAEHLPDIWLSFVTENADWLVDKEHRMLEFSKHAALLFGRSLIKSSEEVTRRINVARRLKQDQELQKGAASGAAPDKTSAATQDDLSLSPRVEHIRRGGSGCVVCREPVRGPKQLLCSGEGCLRLYHSSCIKDTARMPVTARKWLCNDCLDSGRAS